MKIGKKLISLVLAALILLLTSYYGDISASALETSYSGRYYIANTALHYFLRSNSSAQGNTVCTADILSGNSELWDVTKVTTNGYTIRNVDSGLYLGLSGTCTNDAQVGQYSSAYLWKISGSTTALTLVPYSCPTENHYLGVSHDDYFYGNGQSYGYIPKVSTFNYAGCNYWALLSVNDTASVDLTYDLEESISITAFNNMKADVKRAMIWRNVLIDFTSRSAVPSYADMCDNATTTGTTMHGVCHHTMGSGYPDCYPALAPFNPYNGGYYHHNNMINMIMTQKYSYSSNPHYDPSKWYITLSGHTLCDYVGSNHIYDSPYRYNQTYKLAEIQRGTATEQTEYLIELLTDIFST